MGGGGGEHGHFSAGTLLPRRLEVARLSSSAGSGTECIRLAREVSQAALAWLPLPRPVPAGRRLQRYNLMGLVLYCSGAALVAPASQAASLMRIMGTLAPLHPLPAVTSSVTRSCDRGQG